MKAFEMIAETMDMAGLFEDLQIDIDQDEHVEQMLEEKKQAEEDEHAAALAKQEEKDEKKNESRSNYHKK